MPAAKPQQDISILSAQELARIADAVAGLSPNQLVWASGYLAGLAATGEQASVAPLPVTAEAGWTILYGTETGTSRRVAEQLAENSRAAGLSITLIDIRDYKPSRLKKETNLLIVTATHGLGDPPDGTEEFFEFVMGERAPRLEGVGFSVLALGDSSYDDYCQTGRDIDARLEALGAERIFQRVDCDLDYEGPAEAWVEGVVAKARERQGPDTATPRPELYLRPVPSAPAWDRDRPFEADVLVNQPITGRDSSKRVVHVELSLEDSGLHYEPGDALGVVPKNPEALVGQVLELSRTDGNAPVSLAGTDMSLAQALTSRLEITTLSRGFLESYGKVAEAPELVKLMSENQRGELKSYMAGRQVVDVLADFPGPVEAQALADSLRKLQPRLYSIASSLEANPDEVHLTVGLVNYHAHGRDHWGAASSFLAAAGSTVPVFIEPNNHFRLPENPETPIIMIGPGTGIAPFRAFVEQRAAAGAPGTNWLFFGDRNFRSDFLYQLEWQKHLRDGTLHRIDLAFSRDQSEKVYVQDRIREQAKDFYAWLEEGAHVYVCGDSEHMAPDVNAALLDIIAKQSGGSAEHAEDYLRSMKREGRYQRDVY